jgi:MipA family protein
LTRFGRRVHALPKQTTLRKRDLRTASTVFRRYTAGIRSATLAAGLIVPLVAFAELSQQPMLGPGVRTRPAYDGSDSRRWELVPVIRYYGQPWFLRSTQGMLEGGARLALAPGLHAGAQLAYEPGREADESDFLESRRVPDVDVGASLGVHLEWDHKFGPVPIALLARARQHIDSDRGAQADLRLSVGVFQKGPVGAGVFAQATWASAKSTRSFYGITPPQSAVTGLPAFDPGSGWLAASVGLLYQIELSKAWVVVGNLEARRLQGDARHSPLVERATNFYATAGVAYRF